MTLGFRYFTPNLMWGINFEIDREPSLQICLIWTVAHLRLGDREGAESTYMMNAITRGGASAKSWRNRLLALSLRRTDWATIMEEAKSDEQRCQVSF